MNKFKHYDHTTHGTPSTALTLARAQVAVTSITAAGKLATVTTTAAHQYQTGDIVTISGANETDYNGTFPIVKTGSDTFTYMMRAAPTVTTATGTIVANQRTLAEVVILFNPSEDTEISIGPNDSATWYPVGAEESYVIPIQGGQIDLADWYTKSGSASQTLRVLYR